MSANLGAYLDPGEVEQPDWLADELRTLLGSLHEAETDEGWIAAIGELEQRVLSWIGTGRIAGSTAAGILAIPMSLEAGWQAEGKRGAAAVMGFLLQLTLSQGDWDRFLAATAAGGASGHEQGEEKGPMRLDSFLDKIILYFAKRGRTDVIRSLFRLIHYSIDDVARRAMRRARDLEEWLADLSLLAAHLTLRRWLPLTLQADPEAPRRGRVELFAEADGDIVGGRFVCPPQEENPILATLFDAEEIRTLHRKEAYASECFAHLYAAFLAGYMTEQHQRQVPEVYRRRLAEDRLAARQWLALGKSRFEIAPYVQA